MATQKLVVREDAAWEKVVYAEVLVPDVVNNFGDIYTKEAIVEFMQQFALQGYGLDVNHDGADVKGVDYYVIESFIARPGDPDFIEGSWVVGVKVLSDDLWSKVLSGEINGFSYEADVLMTPVTFVATSGRQVSGTTYPDPLDGHVHDYLIVLDALSNPIAGGTSETAGHSHRIVSHTTTEVTNGHNHRYQVTVEA